MFETKTKPIDLQTAFTVRLGEISRARRVLLRGAGRTAEAVRDYCRREGKTLLCVQGNAADRQPEPLATEGNECVPRGPELLFLACDTPGAVREALDRVKLPGAADSVLCVSQDVLLLLFDKDWLAAVAQYYNLLVFIADCDPEPFLLGEFIRAVFECAGVPSRDGFNAPELHGAVLMFLKSQGLDRMREVAANLLGSFRENDVPLSSPKGLFLNYIQAYKAHLLSGETSVTRKVPFFVFSTGHSGTLWMARFLSMIAPDEIVCHHEKVQECLEREANAVGLPSVTRFYGRFLGALQGHGSLSEKKGGIASFLPEYVSFIKTGNALGKMTGDCAGHMPPICRDIAVAFPTGKGILLTRNGILTVSSVCRTLEIFGSAPDYYNEIQEHYSSFPGWVGLRAFRPDFSPFVFACVRWAWVNTHVCDVWGRWPERFRVCRLEDLQIDYEQVRDLKLFLTETESGEELLKAAWSLCTGFDINRHSGRKDPTEVWGSWTPEQRKIFTDICGETMARHGYTIPRIS